MLIEYKDFHIPECTKISNCSQIGGSFPSLISVSLASKANEPYFIFEVCYLIHNAEFYSFLKFGSYITQTIPSLLYPSK
jgi:hypothetical protein